MYKDQQIAYTIKADVLQAYQTFLGKFLADYITPKISNGIFESPVIVGFSFISFKILYLSFIFILKFLKVSRTYLWPS